MEPRRAAHSSFRPEFIAAWGVHALTASGAVLGFFALEAAWRADTPATFFWLGLALIIDGIDGPLARALKIDDLVPRIDGATLDLVVDYLTYVVAPVAWLLSTQRFPGDLAWALAGFVLLTSLYTFARRDMKADSADFRGFPAAWNLVAAAFAVTAAPPWAATAITLLLGALTFSSVRTVHPVRVRALRPLTLAAAAIWMIATAAILVSGSDSGLWLAAWWLSTVYVAALCALRNLLTTASSP